MEQKVFYVFCKSCGGDTAMHSISSRCPFCRADKSSLKILMEMDGSVSQDQLLQALEQARNQWVVKSERSSRFWRKKRTTV